MSFKHSGRGGSTHGAIMAKEKSHEVQCVVQNALPDSRFLVTQELSPYDLNKGRITFRHIEGHPSRRPSDVADPAASFENH